MMGGSVDDNIYEFFMRGIIFLGIGIQITVTATNHPITVQTVAHTDVNAFCLG